MKEFLMANTFVEIQKKLWINLCTIIIIKTSLLFRIKSFAISQRYLIPKNAINSLITLYRSGLIQKEMLYTFIIILLFKKIMNF